MHSFDTTRFRSSRVLLYRSPPHPCSYLPGRLATTLFVDPSMPGDMRTYGRLAEMGFRRSGSYVYRPGCDECNACVSLRLPLARFEPNRSQRRNHQKNADIRVVERAPEFGRDHFDLYNKYTGARHRGSGMDDASPERYMEFLTATWAETVFLELRLDGRLVGVAVTDVMPDALSAVYTFYDPDLVSRAVGTYAILTQVRLAKESKLNWLYLGYWIGACPKMSYKDRFRPVQGYIGEQWREFGRGQRITA